MNFLCNRGGGGIILFAACCCVLSVSDMVLSNEKLMEKSLDVVKIMREQRGLNKVQEEKQEIASYYGAADI